MKKIVYILLLLAIPLSTHAYTFTKPLRLGDENQDVFELQKFLNSIPLTQVSTTGAGSIGNESNYFGQKTKQAVIKLQNLFSAAILTPVGLTAGTGFVGQSTINFINANQQTVVAPTQATTTQQNDTETTVDQRTIETPQFFISKQVAKPDQTLYIGSQNNISDENFYLNSTQMKKKCPTQYTCSVKIDEDTKPGKYEIKSGNSNWGTYDITILDSSTPRPEVSLKSLELKGDNVITGKHLSKKIKIYTMYGVFESETANDSFILEFPEQYVKNPQITGGIFYVENENGLISDILTITYEF
jgi:hypothetical protein